MCAPPQDKVRLPFDYTISARGAPSTCVVIPVDIAVVEVAHTAGIEEMMKIVAEAAGIADLAPPSVSNS